MNVSLQAVRLELPSFTLAVDVQLSGGVTGIFGPSGAGKTSLLELISGIRRPSSGKISFNKIPIVDIATGLFMPPHLRSIGYLPQDGALFPHLTVKKNLLYGLPSLPLATDFKYEQVLEVLEIAPLVNRDVATLSGGEKQRVACGRALIASPRLLLLDEPLANLDSTLKSKLLPFFQKIRDVFSLPMMYVSHDATELATLCDHVLVLSEGKISRYGSPSAIFAESARPHFQLRAD